MKTNFFVWIAVAGMVLATAGQGATNDITTALQKGLFEEEANHNLPAAIKAYEAVVAQFDQDRRLAGTAVFRLGECFRKQGRTNEAVVQYERVLREFADYPELSNLSTQNLNALRAPGQATAVRPEVAEGTKDFNARVTETVEAAEVSRIRAMIKDSPDLINARDSSSENDTRLHTAARLGQATVVQFLLENGAEVDARNKSARTPLHEASVMGRRAVVQLLLDRKADPNATDRNGYTPAHLAAAEGYKAVLEALLAASADPNAKSTEGATPLHRAAARDRKAVAEVLMAKGARVDEPNASGSTALHLAASAGNLSVLSALLDGGANIEAKDSTGATPLVFAGLPVLKILLAHRANPNVSYETTSNNAKLRTWPLLGAIANLSYMELLLASGANPNAQQQWSRDNEQNGWTPLMIAIITSPDSLPCVQLLLKFKADPNLASENGRTPLHFSLGQPKALQELLNAKANVNAATKTGETPLHWAVAAGLKAAVSTLLTNQADVNARDNRGMTPLHWASVSGNQDIAELLLAAKADPNARDNKDRTPLDLSRLQSSFSRYNTQEAQGLQLTRFLEGQGGYGLPSPIPMRAAGSVVLPGGQPSPASYLTDDQKAFAETLKRHGAIEDFPRLDRIEVRRSSVNYKLPIFQKGTNDWNRFTLLELLGTHYYFLAAEPRGEGGSKYAGLPNGWQSGAMEFPDFAHLRIRRPGTTPGTWQEQIVDLAQALETGDCTKDVPLQWGDIVEIPVADHVLNEPWKGFSRTNLESFAKCLSRKVDIVVKGKVTTVSLSPGITIFNNIVSGWSSEITTRIPFWIKPVLLNSKLLLASSDLSRIKVTRLDPATGQKQEYILDCSESKLAPDFWLRDGDTIEVPDKE